MFREAARSTAFKGMGAKARLFKSRTHRTEQFAFRFERWVKRHKFGGPAALKLNAGIADHGKYPQARRCKSARRDPTERNSVLRSERRSSGFRARRWRARQPQRGGGGGGFVFLHFLSYADAFHARLRCLTPSAVSAALSPAPHHDATLVITAVRLSAGIATLHAIGGMRSTKLTALVYCSFITPVVMSTETPPHATNARPSSVACSAQAASVVP